MGNTNYDITIDFNNWIQNKKDKNNNDRERSEEQIIILKAYQLALLYIWTDDIFYCCDMFERLMKAQIEKDLLERK